MPVLFSLLYLSETLINSSVKRLSVIKHLCTANCTTNKQLYIDMVYFVFGDAPLTLHALLRVTSHLSGNIDVLQ
ncbi:hypothetical protein I876_08970 [Alteromonas mediterranea U7]|nr:hypothetical protein I607_08670 [Alteromonas mediterranea U4]AGP89657.1 hypothetical protein I876_08970 [Alteromonas mediterranea U7]AGP93525.1 hypothetical protein I634_09050 [Alteromonas mediterranea U8]